MLKFFSYHLADSDKMSQKKRRLFLFGKTHFLKIVKHLGIVLLKEGFTYIYLAFIYENLIISDLFKTFTLNFTMHILTILTCSLKLRHWK